MPSLTTYLAVLTASATAALALDCEGSVACGISLIAQDCIDASNQIDETATYQPGTRIRQRTCLIEYTCDSGNPIAGTDLKGYYESVTSSCDNYCGNIEPTACPGGGLVSIDYTTKDRKTKRIAFPFGERKNDPREIFKRQESHNNCDGSAVCDGLTGATSFADDCNAAINSINVNAPVTFGTEFSIGNCFMKLECDTSGGMACGENLGGDVVQGACGRAFNECGGGCGSRTIGVNSYCRVDYRAN